jgi:hypothetical protein
VWGRSTLRPMSARSIRRAPPAPSNPVISTGASRRCFFALIPACPELQRASRNGELSAPSRGVCAMKSLFDPATEHPQSFLSAFPLTHVDFRSPHTSTKCKAFKAAVFRTAWHDMNREISRSTNKSLRQNSNSRYNQAVESHAQAPQWRLFHFPSALEAFTQTRKSHLFLDFHILQIDTSPSRVVSITSTLFEKHTGVYPPPSHFGIAVNMSLTPHPSRSHGRLPDRGLFPGSWPDGGPLTQAAVISIFTCKKKAIYPTIGGNAVTANDV